MVVIAVIAVAVVVVVVAAMVVVVKSLGVEIHVVFLHKAVCLWFWMR